MPVFRRRITDRINKTLQGKPETRLFNLAAGRVDATRTQMKEEISGDEFVDQVQNDDFIRGYLGFYPDESPADALEYSIISKINIKRRGRLIKRGEGNVTYRYDIQYPSRSDIYGDHILRLPWISKTWVEAVERGLGNLENFLFQYEAGRSELGVQIKGSLMNERVVTDPNLLNRLKNIFSEKLREGGLRTKR